MSGKQQQQQPDSGAEDTDDAPVNPNANKKVYLSEQKSFAGAELTRALVSAGYFLLPAAAPGAAMLEQCVKADVVVLDIMTGDCDAVKNLLQALQTAPNVGPPKTVLVLSTVMTWAETPKLGGDAADGIGATTPKMGDGAEESDVVPFAEEDYRKRRCHPNYKKQLFVEKYALVKLKRQGVRAYIVSAGALYGSGEDVFHWFFRSAWQGDPAELPIITTLRAPRVEPKAAGTAEEADATAADPAAGSSAPGVAPTGEGQEAGSGSAEQQQQQQEQPKPILISGTNYVPTIHVSDLVSAVLKIIDNPPDEDRYVLAVDGNNCQLRQIVQAISTKLGTGKVKEMSAEEALVHKGLSQRELDLLQVDLRMESLVLRDIMTDWVAESGFVENIGTVVGQYRKTRGLTPIRIAVLGPPASGKSSMCAAIAKHYGVHHVTTAQALAMVNEIADKEFLDELAESKDPATGRLPDAQIAMVVRRRLKDWQCQNQGYVLDGFPKNRAQAEALFGSQSAGGESGAEGGEGTSSAAGGESDEGIRPEHWFVLESKGEGLLRARVMALPQAQVAGTHNTEEGFARRLARWKFENSEDEGVTSWLEEHSMLPIPLDSQSSVETLMEAVVKEVGAPHRYGPSAEEVEEKRRAQEKEAKEKADLEAREREEREARERESQASTKAAWERRLAELRDQERELLHARSLPFRKYLMDSVMPTLSRALVELAEVRPADPVDYLAEYLLRASEDK